MTKARIIHLNRDDDARFPSMIFEIEGNLYIDLLSASLFSLPPTKRDCYEFVYQMKKRDLLCQYFFDGYILIPLNHSAVIACFVMNKYPIYIQHFAYVYGMSFGIPDAEIAIHFGWRDIVEAVYAVNKNLTKPRALSEILKMQLATVEVFEFNPPNSINYHLYACKRKIQEFTQNPTTAISQRAEDLWYWIRGYRFDKEIFEWVKK